MKLEEWIYQKEDDIEYGKTTKGRYLHHTHVFAL